MSIFSLGPPRLIQGIQKTKEEETEDKEVKGHGGDGVSIPASTMRRSMATRHTRMMKGMATLTSHGRRVTEIEAEALEERTTGVSDFYQ